MINPDEAPPGYRATKCDGPLEDHCGGCAFLRSNLPHCISCHEVPCAARTRKDGESVVFVEKTA